MKIPNRGASVVVPENPAASPLEQRVDDFWTACEEWGRANREWREARHAAEQDPECPRGPLDSKEKTAAFHRFLESTGVSALADKSSAAHTKMGKALRAVFDTPAWTVQQLAWKFAVLHQCWAGGDQEQVYTCFERRPDEFLLSIDRDVVELAEIEAKSADWRTLGRDCPNVGLKIGDRVRLSAFPGWLDDGLYAVLVRREDESRSLAYVVDLKFRKKDGGLRRRIIIDELSLSIDTADPFDVVIPYRVLDIEKEART